MRRNVVLEKPQWRFKSSKQPTLITVGHLLHYLQVISDWLWSCLRYVDKVSLHYRLQCPYAQRSTVLYAEIQWLVGISTDPGIFLKLRYQPSSHTSSYTFKLIIWTGQFNSSEPGPWVFESVSVFDQIAKNKAWISNGSDSETLELRSEPKNVISSTLLCWSQMC